MMALKLAESLLQILCLHYALLLLCWILQIQSPPFPSIGLPHKQKTGVEHFWVQKCWKGMPTILGVIFFFWGGGG